MKIANVWAADADNPAKAERAAASSSMWKGPRVVLLGELNNFDLGDKIRAGLAAVANFDVFKIPAGHRSIL
jgi:hypothetical protein